MEKTAKAFIVDNGEQEDCVVLKATTAGQAKMLAIKKGFRFPSEFLELVARRIPILDGMKDDEATDQELYETGMFYISCYIDHAIKKDFIEGDGLPEPKFNDLGCLSECPYCVREKGPHVESKK